MTSINITTRLSIDEYIRVNYHFHYRKWEVKGMTCLGIFLIFLALSTPTSSNNSSWVLLIFGLLMTVGLPAQVYFTAKSNYKSDKRISEKIDYQFDSEEIRVSGESFNSRLTWDKIYSVTESKDCVLIWQNRNIANVIPKRDFKNDELELFKEMVKKAGLKNDFKK